MYKFLSALILLTTLSLGAFLWYLIGHGSAQFVITKLALVSASSTGSPPAAKYTPGPES
jgi:hypothetical protein